MKQQYETPSMDIRWFESENICTISDENQGTDFIPETDGGKDVFGW